MFIVHNELDDGWMWVTNVRTEEQGLIVEDLVEEVVSVLAVKCTPVERRRTILMNEWYLLGARGGSTRGKSVSICSQTRCFSFFVNIEALFLFAQLVSREDHQARGLQPADDRCVLRILTIKPGLIAHLAV